MRHNASSNIHGKRGLCTSKGEEDKEEDKRLDEHDRDVTLVRKAPGL